jgi:hypothetical protein
MLMKDSGNQANFELLKQPSLLFSLSSAITDSESESSTLGKRIVLFGRLGEGVDDAPDPAEDDEASD